jgi:hypothetical protein
MVCIDQEGTRAGGNLPRVFENRILHQAPPSYGTVKKSGALRADVPNPFRCNARQQCPLIFSQSLTVAARSAKARARATVAATTPESAAAAASHGGAARIVDGNDAFTVIVPF